MSAGTNPFGADSEEEEEEEGERWRGEPSGYRVSPLSRPSLARSTSHERGSSSRDDSPRIQRAHGLFHIVLCTTYIRLHSCAIM